MSDLLSLAERVASGAGSDNALDVEVEIALFEPVGGEVAIRANNAGTKIIITYEGGKELTYWAYDWTQHRELAAQRLRARASQEHSK